MRPYECPQVSRRHYQHCMRSSLPCTYSQLVSKTAQARQVARVVREGLLLRSPERPSCGCCTSRTRTWTSATRREAAPTAPSRCAAAEDDGKPNWIANIAAGHWGSPGKCDIPARTLESMLQHVRDHHKASIAPKTGARSLVSPSRARRSFTPRWLQSMQAREKRTAVLTRLSCCMLRNSGTPRAGCRSNI
ncbi:hypothetical protein HPB48_015649 [Haemaphysalis longicornis]|uniref:Uncharacterized protein n=1 Tax=Haemaphysalis longicornis TaxID=44386 RepID=A0A9J6GIN8_HAELO|nr:hypothetical protein HPB48_015649 [Haemaphysalis longicornis]